MPVSLTLNEENFAMKKTHATKAKHLQLLMLFQWLSWVKELIQEDNISNKAILLLRSEEKNV